MSEQNSNEYPSMSKYDEVIAKYPERMTDDEVAAAVKKIVDEHAAENNTEEVKRFIMNSIELTTLKCTDSDESVLAMVEKVNKLDDERPDLPHFATICVYPNFAKVVSESLEADGVEVACVSGGFPSSQTAIEVKIAETALALKDGATEIDMVLSVGKFLSGDYETVCDEISELKSLCGEKKLKVILETGALVKADLIKKASMLSLYAGADFIKTSTGKINPAATLEAAYVMCQALKEYYDETGIFRGIKIAGGIKSVSDAVNYYTVVKEMLGEKWLCKDGFRIGTSSLANLVISELTGEEKKIF